VGVWAVVQHLEQSRIRRRPDYAVPIPLQKRERQRPDRRCDQPQAREEGADTQRRLVVDRDARGASTSTSAVPRVSDLRIWPDDQPVADRRDRLLQPVHAALARCLTLSSQSPIPLPTASGLPSSSLAALNPATS